MSRSPRPRLRAAVALGAAVAVLAALAYVGRAERNRWYRAQNAGIARELALVGSRFSHPSYYRHDDAFDCLIYSTADHPYGLELCFDSAGYVVEAIHRRPWKAPTIYTLRPDPRGATVRVDPALAARLLDRLGAQKGPSILTGFPDLGPARA